MSRSRLTRSKNFSKFIHDSATYSIGSDILPRDQARGILPGTLAESLLLLGSVDAVEAGAVVLLGGIENRYRVTIGHPDN